MAWSDSDSSAIVPWLFWPLLRLLEQRRRVGPVRHSAKRRRPQVEDLRESTDSRGAGSNRKLIRVRLLTRGPGPAFSLLLLARRVIIDEVAPFVHVLALKEPAHVVASHPVDVLPRGRSDRGVR